MLSEVKGEELGRIQRNGTLFPVGFGKAAEDSCQKCCLSFTGLEGKTIKGIMSWVVPRPGNLLQVSEQGSKVTWRCVPPFPHPAGVQD